MKEMPDIHGADKAPGTEHGFRRLILGQCTALDENNGIFAFRYNRQDFIRKK